MTDDLATRRRGARREATLQLTGIGMRLQWRPHWEIGLRLTGRWWFAALGLLVVLGAGAALAMTTLVVADWIAMRDWRAIALALGWAAVAAARIVRDVRRWSDDDGPDGAA